MPSCGGLLSSEMIPSALVRLPILVNSARVHLLAGPARTKYHRLVVETTEINFLTILDARRPKSRYLPVWFLLMPLSLTCRCPLSLCPYTVVPLAVLLVF